LLGEPFEDSIHHFADTAQGMAHDDHTCSDVSKQVKTVAPISISDYLRSNICVDQWEIRDEMG
jgi:hypothetical protein